MKNPVVAVKETFVKHKTKLVYGAGVATGAGVVILMRKTIPVDIIAPISNTQLQHLIDHTEDAMTYVDPRGHTVTLFNEILRQKN